jgi:hypothetical protein
MKNNPGQRKLKDYAVSPRILTQFVTFGNANAK